MSMDISTNNNIVANCKEYNFLIMDKIESVDIIPTRDCY
jgi:hypothetical protein